MKKTVWCGIVCAAMLPVACQQQKQPEPSDTETANKVLPPLHLGAVHQVYPDQGFALLRIIGPIPAPGTVLITHPADGSNTRIGNIQVTADAPADNRIIAAQIRAGQLVKGDRVFLYRHLMEPEEKPTEEIPKPVTPMHPVEQPAQPSPMPPSSPATPADETAPSEPTIIEPQKRPTSPATEHKTPEHIFDIPDNIDDWD